jgi:hypothetical protein
VNQKLHFFVPQIKGLKFLKIFIFLAVYYTKFPPLFNGVKIFLGKSILAYGFLPKNKALFYKNTFSYYFERNAFVIQKINV